MSTEQDFEVLETMMFERPPEWGRRVVKKADGEIMLQTTEDKGLTWTDQPIPEARLMLPTVQTRTASTGNVYAGLAVVPRDATATRSVTGAEKELNPDIVAAIESGQLLTKAENDKGIETVTFLSIYAASGLVTGTVWRDSDNYLRIV